MKTLFALALGFMLIATVGTIYSLPEHQSDVPIIYWVTDVNPARQEQAELFRAWLIEQGHTTADGSPICELRLDTANRDPTKLAIQGVSGVAGDVMDMTGGYTLQRFQAIGLVRDVTDAGRRLGFDPDSTYAVVESEITVDGRQYMYPCNVGLSMYWVNLDTLSRHGISPPPRRWTVEEFESIGRRFVEAANPPGTRQRTFFAGDMDLLVLVRSFGMDTYNETYTRCTLDDPRYVRALELMRRWVYEERLIPSATDRASFTVDGGQGGADAQLFARGRLAMIRGDRSLLVRFRQFDRDRAARGEPPMSLACVEPPHGGFPSVYVGARGAAVYAGSRHPELAELFLAYLASEPYNMHVVRDADGLPPNSIYTRTETFTNPPDYPGEGGLHEAFAETAETVAIPGSDSPFILTATMIRLTQDAFQSFMAGRITAEAAAAQAAARVHEEMERTLQEQPVLRAEFERRLQTQKLIDERRAANQPIPEAWVQNPFHKVKLRRQGELE